MDTIKEIKQSVDLVQYISRYVELKKNGKVWQGKCCFHPDSDPSLVVWDNGSWKCFGCDAQGDIFQFIQLHDGLSFTEAYYHLCEECNIEPEDIVKPQVDYLKSLKKSKKLDTNIKLPEISSEKIKEYIKRQHAGIKEKWSENVINTFKIGFCTDVNDIMYGRVTIPLYDANNRLVGVAGRRVDKFKVNKYKFLNGVNKSDLLYNLNLALPYIKQQKEMIIVEGYKDVWRCWEAGVKNVVALMGNLASDTQIQMIIRYSFFNVVLALDNDKGGEKGKEKLSKRLKHLCKLREISYPEGKKDLGECNIEEVKKCILFKKEGNKNSNIK